MPSFLSAAEKSQIDSVLDDLHDTYKVEIFAYVAVSQVNVVDTTYSSLYGKPSTSLQAPNTNVLERHSIYARVKYMENQKEGYVGSSLPESKGIVRVKVDSAGSELLKISKRVEVDDIFYTVDSDPSVVGMFGANYFTYYLKREA